jgi:hypothetical protein
MQFTALWSKAVSGIGFFPKVNPLFKNGQKKCPKMKTQNTFVQKAMPFHPLLTRRGLIVFLLFLLP